MASATFYSKTKTAVDDNAFQLDDEGRTYLEGCNIHCYTQDAYYGNATVQAAIVAANAVVWFDKRVRVADLWFKNKTAGQNCTITVTGIISG